MKNLWLTLAPIALLILLACSLFEPDFRPPECAALDLTPEECANLGTHSYSFKTEFACTSVVMLEGETFRVSFFEAGLELENIEPNIWVHQYVKVAPNQYVWKYAGVEGVPQEVTVEFTLDGFTMLGTEQPDCGKYIRTFLP
jgi:hypothetical protein